MSEKNKATYVDIFEKILKSSDICYIRNYSTQPQPFMGLNLENFDFIAFNSLDVDKKYVIDVIGFDYPNPYEKDDEAYEIDAKIPQSSIDDNRKNIEHVIFWQNLFSGSFKSLLVFFYEFKDKASEEKYKSIMKDKVEIVEYEEKTNLRKFGIAVIKGDDYLSYINLNEIDPANIKFNPGDGPNFLTKLSDFLTIENFNIS